MEFSPELFAALVAAVAFAAGLWFVRARRRQTRTRGGSGRARGPANLRFTCANCTKQFTHSRRTLLAYEQGARQFFCSACHTRWRGSQSVIQNRTHGPGEMLARRDAHQAKQTQLAEAAKRVQPPAPGLSSNAGAKKGCLGAAALLVVAPAILGWTAVHYYF
jgi:LSD1 subclass zinc finger protein